MQVEKALFAKSKEKLVPMHLINDIVYKASEDVYNMVMEIPAGSNEKWQTNANSGALYFEHVNEKPRIIEFLPYPFNYGFIPQTILSKDKGGDGDPIDVVLISQAQQRGSIQPLKILGALKFIERGEDDNKLIGVLEHDPFAKLNDISEMLYHFRAHWKLSACGLKDTKAQGLSFFKVMPVTRKQRP
jgi:inorganic pyrophosphatase